MEDQITKLNNLTEGGSVAKKKTRKKPLKPITPNSLITSMLRRLWLFSRERRERLRMDDSTCFTCKRKASVAKGKECKIEIHHIDHCQMDRIIAVIREELLIPSDGLMTLCKDCHRVEHKKGNI